MAKKFGKFLLLTAAVGTGVAAAYYFLQKKDSSPDPQDEDEDYDDLGEDLEEDSPERTYVPLNMPGSEAEETPTQDTPAGEAGEAAREVCDACREAAEKTCEACQETVEAAEDKVQDLQEAAEDKVQDLQEAAEETVQDAVDAAQRHVSGLKEQLQSAGEEIEEFFNEDSEQEQQ